MAVKKICKLLLLCFVTVASVELAQGFDRTWELAVEVSAAVQLTPLQLHLSWRQDTTAIPTSYVVYRKSPSATSWGTGTVLSGEITNYTDSTIVEGETYEYQIIKNTPTYKGYGYLYSGVNVPLVESRGSVLLLVDSTFSTPLSNELSRLQQDLIGDGWKVIRHDVSRTAAVPSIKAIINGYYWEDPVNLKSVFLIGHVPVPYSGNLFPDEHPDHRGAWPADVYYADIDGNWTDSSVNATVAADPRNRNVPGDGKFDQTFVPTAPELQMGRADFANMPGRLTWDGPPTFPSEQELLRRYLNKNHNFRHRIISAPERGIVFDACGYYNGLAYAASAFRNFSAFFSFKNVTYVSQEGQWLPTLNNDAHLWAYACNSGSFKTLAGVGTHGAYNEAWTSDLVQQDPKVIFAMLYGSWFGDWDSEDNFMRGLLAAPAYGLACVWSGTPHFFLQHMALGEPIGFGTKLTQGNASNGLYRNQTNVAARGVHTALLGDPTLRMHTIAPPSNLSATPGFGSITLNWIASSDAIAGYHVYRSSSPTGPFSRLTGSVITGTSFTDNSPGGSANTYMVRAIKLQTSASGSYFNASQGVFATATAMTGPKPVITVVASDPTASRVGPDSGAWRFTRSANVSGDIFVKYSLGGTAVKWTDYRRAEGDMPEIILLPSGATNTTLTIHPVASSNLVGELNAVLTLTSDSAYDINSPSNASIVIHGNAITSATASAIEGNVGLTWSSGTNRKYRVAMKNSFDDSNWTDLGVLVNSGGGSTTWIDSTPQTAPQRFYRVFQVE
jgi:hypothetical protein